MPVPSRASATPSSSRGDSVERDLDGRPSASEKIKLNGCLVKAEGHEGYLITKISAFVRKVDVDHVKMMSASCQ
jgi:hypothetical protein